MRLTQFLASGKPAKPIPLASALSRVDARFWPRANKRVLWGWKRDDESNSRTVFFTAVLARDRHGISARNAFFFYRHRTTASAARSIAGTLRASAALFSGRVCEPALHVEQHPSLGLATVTFKLGVPSPYHRDLACRLLRRQPRKTIAHSQLPDESKLANILSYFPVDIYAGSGVSYEAGLPTLCDVHDVFCLDDHEHHSFTFGDADLLPAWFADRGPEQLKRFCELHVKALSARPTPAQRVIADLRRRGLARKIFSDNVDNMLAKVGVPFERTRGTGVFNERHDAKFRSRTLLVVGVAADRRQLIRQARGRKMNIIVVDPCGKVSHGVQHLNFVRPTDHFFKMTAADFFGALSAHLLT